MRAYRLALGLCLLSTLALAATPPDPAAVKGRPALPPADRAGTRALVASWLQNEPDVFGAGTTLVDVTTKNRRSQLTLGGTFYLHASRVGFVERVVGRLTQASSLPDHDVFVQGPDGRVQPLDAYLGFPARPKAAPKTYAADVKNAGAVGGFPYTGALSDKRLAISPGHGWYYDSDDKAWYTQRSEVNKVTEDFTNLRMGTHVMDALEHAGATIYSVRERDLNTREIVVDNGDAAYRESGTWSAGATAGVGYNDTYRTHVYTAGSGDYAAWTPSFPMGASYAVYLRYPSGTNRSTATLLTVKAADGEHVLTVNQQDSGSRWLYLGRYPFHYGNGTGEGVYMWVTGGAAGQYIIADAVKFGGGMGSTLRNGAPSGKARWEEDSYYWALTAGLPSSQFPSLDERDADVTIRPIYANWLDADAYLSLHTNASGTTTPGTGTETYMYNGTATTGSESWRNVVHSRIVNAIKAQWDASWVDRGTKSADFGEVRALSTMPGCLTEIAFHDNPDEAAYILRPLFRDTIARAVTRAALDFLAGTSAVLYPLPVQALRLTLNGSVLSIRWSPTPDALYLGTAPTGYRVYVTELTPTPVAKLYTTTQPLYDLPLSPGKRVHIRVSATNAGGESFASETLVARLSNAGKADLLLVNGFDRQDKSVQEEDNTHDYLIRHAEMIDAAGDWGYVSASNEAVDQDLVPLTAYRAVDWQAGEEAQLSGEDAAFQGIRSAERTRLQSYLAQGGALLVSGSEIGWDAFSTNSGAHGSAYQTFLTDVLQAGFVSDDAGEYGFAGVAGGPFAGLGGSFDDGTQGSYDVDWPDVLSASPQASLCLTYTTTSKGLAVCYNASYHLIYMGVPIETFYPASTRAALMTKALAYLLPTGPTPGDSTSDTDGDTDSETTDGDTGTSETPDGDSEATDTPDGDTATETPDGDTATETPDGDTATETPDGDTAAETPDGDTATETPDGDTNAPSDGDTGADTDKPSPDGDAASEPADGDTSADGDSSVPCRDGYTYQDGMCVRTSGGSGGGGCQNTGAAPLWSLLLIGGAAFTRRRFSKAAQSLRHSK